MSDPFDAEGRPRFCGCPDNVINERQAWPLNREISIGDGELTLTDRVSATEQLVDLVEALEAWAVFGDLTFAQALNPTEAGTDITLAYHMGAHGDGHPFDGLGNVVGHAWGPPDGRIHHDNAESWTPSLRRRVTRHEAGHALGLPHAPTPDNIMYPYLTDLEALGPWDIGEIIARYGIADEAPPPPTIPPPPMMLAIRRSELTINDGAAHDNDMLKVYAADGDSGFVIAESVYYPDGFMVLEIPECRRFSLQLTSPVMSVWAGPWPWVSGVLKWLAINFETEAKEPTDPSAGPWQDAEIVIGDAMQLKVKVRFLTA